MGPIPERVPQRRLLRVMQVWPCNWSSMTYKLRCCAWLSNPPSMLLNWELFRQCLKGLNSQRIKSCDGDTVYSAPSPSQTHPPVISNDFLSVLLFCFAFLNFAMEKVNTLVVWETSEPNHDQYSSKFTQQSNASTNRRQWPKQATRFPKGPTENIDSTCFINGRCSWSVAAMLHKQLRVLICARAASDLGHCHTHECESNTQQSRLWLAFAEPWVNFQLPLKEVAKVFGFFQELPGDSTPDLPTRARSRRLLTMPVVRPLSSGPQF